MTSETTSLRLTTNSGLNRELFQVTSMKFPFPEVFKWADLAALSSRSSQMAPTHSKERNGHASGNWERRIFEDFDDCDDFEDFDFYLVICDFFYSFGARFLRKILSQFCAIWNNTRGLWFLLRYIYRLRYKFRISHTVNQFSESDCTPLVDGCGQCSQP